jgi:energy-coupling factor transport system permease protein
LSPEFRIVSYLLFITSLFLLPDLVFFAGLLVVLSLCLVTVPFRTLKAGWIPIIMFLTFTFISNALYHSGRIIYAAGPVMITQEGLHLAALRTLRILLMIGGVKFLMARTKTDHVVRAMANLLKPFEKLGVPVKDFFHTMGLTLKCFPILKDAIARHYTEIIQRGGAQSMLSKARLMALFMLPLFVESIHSPELFFLEADLHEEKH